MGTVLQRIEPLLAGAIGPTGVKILVQTLPPSVLREVGSLDVIEVRELMAQIDAGQRLFGKPGKPLMLYELRTAITAGISARAHVEVFHIRSDADVPVASRACQALTKGFFGTTDSVRLATATSELARNIYMYARFGDITLRLEEEPSHFRFEVLAVDQGPGIPNIDLVLSGGYVSKTGLGRGILGARKLLEALTIDTGPGKGTRIRGVRRTRKL